MAINIRYKKEPMLFLCIILLLNTANILFGSELLDDFKKRMPFVNHGSFTSPFIIKHHGEQLGKKLHINEHGSFILSKINLSTTDAYTTESYLFRATTDQGWLTTLADYWNSNQYAEKADLFALSEDGKWLAYLTIRTDERTKSYEPLYLHTITFNRLSQGIVKTYPLATMVNENGLFTVQKNSCGERSVSSAHQERYESYRATVTDMYNKVMTALAVSNDGAWVALSNNKTIYLIDMNKEKYHTLVSLPYSKSMAQSNVTVTLDAVTALNFNPEGTCLGAAQLNADKQSLPNQSKDTYTRLIMPIEHHKK